jgi:hypothetical protein
MNNLLVYKAESSIENFATNNVIAYTMPLVKWEIDEKAKESVLAGIKINHSEAGMNDSDLYYTKSVFVTTNWNKNTDVFDRVETWAARHTPSHKPTNIEHNEKDIIGHITDCWAMTIDGQIIADNIEVDDLPNIYHLVNGAVIYRGWRDAELSAKANELITQIEKGEKFVSMECMFRSFDYALMTAEGKCTIVPRSESTAWMTKHLRAYGGDGEHDGYKLGRLLRNITFTGKGYVDRPANPDSIIFNNASIFDFTKANQENVIIKDNGVYFNRPENLTENTNMANENDTMKKELEEAQAALKEAVDTKASIEEKLAKAETTTVELQTSIEAAKKDAEESKDKAKKACADLEEINAKLVEVQTSNAELTKQLEALALANLTASRIATLVEGGIDKEIATKKVSVYANLNDEQWTDLANELVEAAKKKFPPEDMSKKDDKKGDCKAEDETENETNADTKILDNVEVPTEPNLAAAGDETDDTADLRKELQQALASRLGINIEDSK